MQPRTLGFAQAIIGTLAVTPDAVLLRLAEMHGGGSLWVTTCMKLIFISVFCMLHPLTLGPSKIIKGIRAGPKHVFLAALGQGLINMGYALAFLTTTVTEALMLISLHPLWCALGCRLVLGDRIPTRTAVALASALIAVLIIFVPPAILGTNDYEGSPRSSLHGNVIALFTGVILSATIIVNRHAGLRQEAGLMPPSVEVALEAAAGIGSLGCGLVTLPIACSAGFSPHAAESSLSFTNSTVLAASAESLGSAIDGETLSSGACAAFGALLPAFWPLVALDALCIAVCTVLATVLAPRHLMGAEIGLILLGEQVLSPVWTYLGVGEVPSNFAIGGGGLLVATLAMHELAGLVEERREARKASMAPQPQQQGGGVMEMAVTTESKA